MEGTLPVQQATVSDPTAECVEGICASAVAGDGGQQAADLQAPTAEAVPEAGSTTRPGRPRTIPTAQRCCPHEGCRAYGRLGDDPLHDVVGCGTHTTGMAAGLTDRPLSLRELLMCPVPVGS